MSLTPAVGPYRRPISEASLADVESPGNHLEPLLELARLVKSVRREASSIGDIGSKDSVDQASNKPSVSDEADSGASAPSSAPDDQEIRAINTFIDSCERVSDGVGAFALFGTVELLELAISREIGTQSQLSIAVTGLRPALTMASREEGGMWGIKCWVSLPKLPSSVAKSALVHLTELTQDVQAISSALNGLGNGLRVTLDDGTIDDTTAGKLRDSGLVIGRLKWITWKEGRLLSLLMRAWTAMIEQQPSLDVIADLIAVALDLSYLSSEGLGVSNEGSGRPSCG